LAFWHMKLLQEEHHLMQKKMMIKNYISKLLAFVNRPNLHVYHEQQLAFKKVLYKFILSLKHIWLICRQF
jgi:hypothetical protein